MPIRYPPSTANSAQLARIGDAHPFKITINNSLIANDAGPEGTNGGGINITSATQATITNTTISGNQAPGGFGGGIYTGGSVNLVNSTMANNRAYFGANFYTSSSQAQTMKNSIVANPVEGGNCAIFNSPSISYTSSGGNLEYPGTSCSFVSRGVGQGADPLLLPLADNGGPTKTQAIPANGPALDGSTTGATTRDQRSAPAYDGDGNGSVVRDVGAHEYVPDAALKPTLNLPGSILRAPEGSDGTVVTYEATATDFAGRSLSPSCSPASGSRFPVGTTQVACTATDSGGRTANGSFQVHVSRLQTELSATSNATVVDFGNRAAISGSLRDQFGTDLSDASVTLFAAPAGTRDFQPVRNLRTGTDGTFTTDVRPAVNTVYGLSYSGDANYVPSDSAAIPVDVRMVLSLDLSKQKVDAGRSVSISGDATPSHSGTVQLTIKRNGKTIGTRDLALSTTSPYRTSYRPKKPGDYKFVASIGGDADHAGDTVSRGLKVTRG